MFHSQPPIVGRTASSAGDRLVARLRSNPAFYPRAKVFPCHGPQVGLAAKATPRKALKLSPLGIAWPRFLRHTLAARGARYFTGTMTLLLWVTSDGLMK
jgi:hypothetical protein